MKKVLVIGDVIIDEFHYMKKLGVSAETPTIVATPGTRELMYGGASCVVRHIQNLGHEMYKASLPIEIASFPLETTNKFDTDGLWEKHYWKRSKKTRYFVDGYKMLQVDDLNDRRHNEMSRTNFLNCIEYAIKQSDVVVIADNRHGVLDEQLAEDIIQCAFDNDKRVIVDSQVSQSSSNHHWYRAVHLICMNERELHAAMAYEGYDVSCHLIKDSVEMISDDLGSDIIVKLGDRGCHAYIDGSHYSVPAPRVEVVDTCGAGDAFLSVVATEDWDDPEAMLKKAVEYASLSCTVKGTGVPNVNA